MPFSGPSSYLATIDEFIGHWTDVNAARAPGALVLNGPYALADLQTDRTALAAEMTELVNAINVLEGHRTVRDKNKPKIRERMRQLGSSVKGKYDLDGFLLMLVPDDGSGATVERFGLAGNMVAKSGTFYVRKK